MSSRLSTGAGGSNINKKNLTMNTNDNNTKGRSNNFSKSNLNLNTQLF